jgi:hypothetical protein
MRGVRSCVLLTVLALLVGPLLSSSGLAHGIPSNRVARSAADASSRGAPNWHAVSTPEKVVHRRRLATGRAKPEPPGPPCVTAKKAVEKVVRRRRLRQTIDRLEKLAIRLLAVGVTAAKERHQQDKEALARAKGDRNQAREALQHDPLYQYLRVVEDAALVNWQALSLQAARLDDLADEDPTDPQFTGHRHPAGPCLASGAAGRPYDPQPGRGAQCAQRQHGAAARLL